VGSVDVTLMAALKYATNCADEHYLCLMINFVFTNSLIHTYHCYSMNSSNFLPEKNAEINCSSLLQSGLFNGELIK